MNAAVCDRRFYFQKMHVIAGRCLVMFRPSAASLKLFHTGQTLGTEMGQVNPHLILTSVKNSVATLTMNDPKKLNGWTGPMMLTLRHLFLEHAKDDKTKVTGLFVPSVSDPRHFSGSGCAAMRMWSRKM